MAAEDDGKTEDPTGRRLDEARAKGQVTQSQEMRLWASLMSGFIILTLLVGHTATSLRTALSPIFEHLHEIHLSVDELDQLLARMGVAVAEALAWPFIVVIGVTIGVLVAQTKGFMWTPSKLIPDFSRLNPIDHFSKMFSMQQAVDLLKNLFKLIVMGTVLVLLVTPHISQFANLGRLDLMGMLSYIGDRIFTLFLAAVIMQSCLTAFDYWFQHKRFMDQMKMSKQEVRDEHKQQEGDPMIKGKLRSLRMKRARQRMMQAVPDADVVVTNPTHYAVALKYDMLTMTAPHLVAKGADLIAKRIREIADENEVPIVENPPLARALFASVELDQEIPPEHYKAVAEVIGYVMRLKGKIASARRPA